MRKHLPLVFVGVVLLGLLGRPNSAIADAWGEAVGGAAEGALFGAIIGGGDGAAAGAALGGVTGLAAGSAREEEQRQQAAQQRYEMERAQWEEERQRQQQQLQMEREQAWRRQQQVQQPPSVQAAAPVPGTDAALVTEIQRSLTRLGYNPGPIDGRPGGQTVEGIRAYQRDRGLIEDGRPSYELLRHMVQQGGVAAVGELRLSAGLLGGTGPAPPRFGIFGHKCWRGDVTHENRRWRFSAGDHRR